MGGEELRIVEEIQKALSMEDVAGAVDDEEAAARLGATLKRFAEPDFDVSMIASATAGGGAFEDRGPQGFQRLWEDWVEPFETFRIEIEEQVDADDKVVSQVRLTGRTMTGGVEITQRAGAVWTVAAGKLSRVAFYLDPDDAVRAAGLESQSGQE